MESTTIFANIKSFASGVRSRIEKLDKRLSGRTVRRGLWRDGDLELAGNAKATDAVLTLYGSGSLTVRENTGLEALTASIYDDGDLLAAHNPALEVASFFLHGAGTVLVWDNPNLETICLVLNGAESRAALNNNLRLEAVLAYLHDPSRLTVKNCPNIYATILRPLEEFQNSQFPPPFEQLAQNMLEARMNQR